MVILINAAVSFIMKLSIVIDLLLIGMAFYVFPAKIQGNSSKISVNAQKTIIMMKIGKSATKHQ